MLEPAVHPSFHRVMPGQYSGSIIEANMNNELVTKALMAQIEFNMAAMEAMLTLSGLVEKSSDPQLVRDMRNLSNLNGAAIEAVKELLESSIRDGSHGS